jgi:YVTN family beta-propeller protein
MAGSRAAFFGKRSAVTIHRMNGQPRIFISYTRRKSADRAAVCLLLACFAAFGQVKPAPYTRTTAQSGTKVEVTIEHVDPAKTAADPLMEFEPVSVRYRLVDAQSGSPVAGASLAAWIDRLKDGEKTTQEQCIGKVKRFAEGSTFSRTSIDLTSYYVAIMNADATVTVVDPRFGYGDTRLLAMVSLDAPGEDWALTGDGKRLFISMPEANKVAAIDTGSWKISASVSNIPKAARVILQPDEAYVWVAYSGEKDSGVVAVSTREFKTVARIPTGRGYHHLAFTADSSFAFVTNPDDGTVSVIDVRKLAKVRDIQTGAKPTWITYSDLAKAAYVANEGDGDVVAIDAASLSVLAHIKAAPGLGQIRFAPGGRFALVVNPDNDLIYVIDSASNRIVQRGKLDKGPDQIAFTNKQAHIRHRGSDVVLMISLESLGVPGAEISVADFSGGVRPPGKMSRFTPADGVVQASGENAVLVANPGDKAVYFYSEGMAAAMGNFSDYGREPRAVLSVDRNLRERSPGVYETTATLPAASSYDLSLLIDAPRVISCFDLPVAPDPRLAQFKPPKLKVQTQIAPSATTGGTARLAFRITYADSGRPATDIKDVLILMAGPAWQRRQVATHTGDGIYYADFTVPMAGVYTVLMSADSSGLTYSQYATVRVDGPRR